LGFHCTGQASFGQFKSSYNTFKDVLYCFVLFSKNIFLYLHILQQS